VIAQEVIFCQGKPTLDLFTESSLACMIIVYR
jgi:hypothetical protein